MKSRSTGTGTSKTAKYFTAALETEVERQLAQDYVRGPFTPFAKTPIKFDTTTKPTDGPETIAKDTPNHQLLPPSPAHKGNHRGYLSSLGQYSATQKVGYRLRSDSW